ncbi:MAG: S41 family peptidase [Phycisphaerales bacterium]|nr:S41 family peptidase [Phycisphaerales bacterium]
MPRRALITAAAPLSIALLCGITPVQGSPEADWTGVQAGLPQYPSLTPNGSHVVWSQGGDLFSASTSGGDAHRLTAHPANELGSAISPDGRLLAFESNRDGTTNLYVMPIAQRDGRLVADGAVRRVTTSDRTQALGGFSHDGRDLLFASTHEPTIYRAPRLYAVSADGGPVRRLTDAQGRAPRMSPDGRTLTFTRGFAPWARPAYRGSGNREVWTLDLPTGQFDRVSQARSNEGQAFTRPDGSTVVVSSRDGQNNIWIVPKGATLAQAKQRTMLKPSEDETTIGHGVRDLTVSGDGRKAAYVGWDKLHLVDLDARDEPEPIAVRTAADLAAASTRNESLDRKVSEAALHPSGKAIALVARGEVLVRAMDEDTPAATVTSSHAREQDIAWSPDGLQLFYSTDEGGHESIRAATVSLAREDLEPEEETDDEREDTEEEEEEEEETEAADPEPQQPAPQPDKDEADRDTDAAPVKEAPAKEKPAKNTTGERWAGALRFEPTVLIEGDFDAYAPSPSPDGRSLLWVRDRGDLMLRDLETGEDTLLLASWNVPDVRWLPDGRHIVYSVGDLDFNSDVWLMDVTEPQNTVNLTRHPDIDIAPRISDDGSFMVFLSDRGRIGHNYEFDVYAMAIDPTLMELSDWALEQRLDAATKKASAKKLLPLLAEGETHEASDPLTFDDLDSAWRRVRRISDFDGSESDLYLTPDGKRIVFSAEIDGDKGLWSADHEGKNRKAITSGGVSDVRGLPTGKTISMVAASQAKTAPAAGGTAKTRSIDVDTRIDVAAEQRQKFDHTARVFGRTFYHPTMKGLDWDALTDRYGELASKTRTSQAFNRVVDEFFGEVNGSHTGIRGGYAQVGTGRTSLGYLGIESRPVPGGHEVVRVLERGPAHRSDGGLECGDVIRAVDGLALATDDTMLPMMDLGAALRDTSGDETLLEVRSAEGDDRIELITPVSYTTWRNLAYEDEVESRRAQVEEASQGRLGYLHIRGMNMPSVHDFERDLHAAAHDKDGLIIDVRDNGGGFTTDILLTSLTAPVHAYTIPRGADQSLVRPDSYPRDRRLLYAFSRPIAVLCNENSFSNAEIFSHAIQTADRGPVIGQETFGGVISTGAFTLIDGSTVRQPFRGWYLPDGTDMESRGAIPDQIVEHTPAHDAAGEDPQLEAAVKRLLRDTPDKPATVSPKPAA